MTLLEQLSSGLGVPTLYVMALARSASYRYKTYPIRKRDGGSRTINHPSRELKATQRWLLSEVISRWPVHAAAMAYRPGISTKDNAAKHAVSRYLLRMDLENFFDSITDTDIRTFLVTHQSHTTGWAPSDVDLFLDLVCRYGSLTIGAPTSPAVSNALCFDLDTSLDGLASGTGVVYTRYADDLFFSTATRDVLKQIEASVPSLLASLKFPSGLKINSGKTRHSSKKGARRVTGITLGSDGRLYAGRQLKRIVRAKIHKYAALSPRERKRLAGLIAYIQGIDPDFVNALVLKYGHALIAQVREAG